MSFSMNAKFGDARKGMKADQDGNLAQPCEQMINQLEAETSDTRRRMERAAEAAKLSLEHSEHHLSAGRGSSSKAMSVYQCAAAMCKLSHADRRRVGENHRAGQDMARLRSRSDVLSVVTLTAGVSYTKKETENCGDVGFDDKGGEGTDHNPIVIDDNEDEEEEGEKDGDEEDGDEDDEEDSADSNNEDDRGGGLLAEVSSKVVHQSSTQPDFAVPKMNQLSQRDTIAVNDDSDDDIRIETDESDDEEWESDSASEKSQEKSATAPNAARSEAMTPLYDSDNTRHGAGPQLVDDADGHHMGERFGITGHETETRAYTQVRFRVTGHDKASETQTQSQKRKLAVQDGMAAGSHPAKIRKYSQGDRAVERLATENTTVHCENTEEEGLEIIDVDAEPENSDDIAGKKNIDVADALPGAHGANPELMVHLSGTPLMLCRSAGQGRMYLVAPSSSCDSKTSTEVWPEGQVHPQPVTTARSITSVGVPIEANQQPEHAQTTRNTLYVDRLPEAVQQTSPQPAGKAGIVKFPLEVATLRRPEFIEHLRRTTLSEEMRSFLRAVENERLTVSQCYFPQFLTRDVGSKGFLRIQWGSYNIRAIQKEVIMVLWLDVVKEGMLDYSMISSSYFSQSQCPCVWGVLTDQEQAYFAKKRGIKPTHGQSSIVSVAYLLYACEDYLLNGGNITNSFRKRLSRDVQAQIFVTHAGPQCSLCQGSLTKMSVEHPKECIVKSSLTPGNKGLQTSIGAGSKVDTKAAPQTLSSGGKGSEGPRSSEGVDCEIVASESPTTSSEVEGSKGVDDEIKTSEGPRSSEGVDCEIVASESPTTSSEVEGSEGVEDEIKTSEGPKTSSGVQGTESVDSEIVAFEIPKTRIQGSEEPESSVGQDVEIEAGEDPSRRLVYPGCCCTTLSRSDRKEREAWQTLKISGENVVLENLGVLRFMGKNVFTFEENGKLFMSLEELTSRGLLPLDETCGKVVTECIQSLPTALQTEVRQPKQVECAFLSEFFGDESQFSYLVTPFALKQIYRRLSSVDNKYRVHVLSLFYKMRLGHHCHWTLQVTPPTSQLHQIAGYEHPEGLIEPAAMIIGTEEAEHRGAVEYFDGGGGTLPVSKGLSDCLLLLLTESISSFKLHDIAEPFCTCPLWATNLAAFRPLAISGVVLHHITEMTFAGFDHLHCWKRNNGFFVSLAELYHSGLFPEEDSNRQVHEIITNLLDKAKTGEDKCVMMDSERIFLSLLKSSIEKHEEDTSKRKKEFCPSSTGPSCSGGQQKSMGSGRRCSGGETMPEAELIDTMKTEVEEPCYSFRITDVRSVSADTSGEMCGCDFNTASPHSFASLTGQDMKTEVMEISNTEEPVEQITRPASTNSARDGDDNNETVANTDDPKDEDDCDDEENDSNGNHDDNEGMGHDMEVGEAAETAAEVKKKNSERLNDQGQSNVLINLKYVLEIFERASVLGSPWNIYMRSKFRIKHWKHVCPEEEVTCLGDENGSEHTSRHAHPDREPGQTADKSVMCWEDVNRTEHSSRQSFSCRCKLPEPAAKEKAEGIWRVEAECIPSARHADEDEVDVKPTLLPFYLDNVKEEVAETDSCMPPELEPITEYAHRVSPVPSPDVKVVFDRDDFNQEHSLRSGTEGPGNSRDLYEVCHESAQTDLDDSAHSGQHSSENGGSDLATGARLCDRSGSNSRADVTTWTPCLEIDMANPPSSTTSPDFVDVSYADEHSDGDQTAGFGNHDPYLSKAQDGQQNRSLRRSHLHKRTGPEEVIVFPNIDLTERTGDDIACPHAPEIVDNAEKAVDGKWIVQALDGQFGKCSRACGCLDRKQGLLESGSILQCVRYSSERRCLKMCKQIGEAVICGRFVWLFKRQNGNFFSVLDLEKKGLVNVSFAQTAGELLEGSDHVAYATPGELDFLRTAYTFQKLTHGKVDSMMVSAQALCLLSQMPELKFCTPITMETIYIHQVGHICPDPNSLASKVQQVSIPNLPKIRQCWVSSFSWQKDQESVQGVKLLTILPDQELEEMLQKSDNNRRRSQRKTSASTSQNSAVKTRSSETLATDQAQTKSGCFAFMRIVVPSPSYLSSAGNTAFSWLPLIEDKEESVAEVHLFAAGNKRSSTPTFKVKRKTCLPVSRAVIAGASVCEMILLEADLQTLKTVTHERCLHNVLGQIGNTHTVLLTGVLRSRGMTYRCIKLEGKLYVNWAECMQAFSKIQAACIYHAAVILRIFLYQVPTAVADHLAKYYKGEYPVLAYSPWVCTQSLYAISRWYSDSGHSRPLPESVPKSSCEQLYKLFVNLDPQSTVFPTCMLFKKRTTDCCYGYVPAGSLL